MAKSPPPPVTFIACAAGSEVDRARLLHTLGQALHPGDEALVADGSYGPVASVSAASCPPGVTVLGMPDVTRAVAYDRLALDAAHEALVFVGTGCAFSRADMDRLRTRLSTAMRGVVVSVPGPTGATVGLDGRAVLAVSRPVLRAVGGLAATEDRARRVAAGFVGSSELFEVFVHEVRR
ncbi:MAG: hypothetical protein ACRDY1_04470, partial [Acidimicrobiales bacterium]